MKARRCAHRNPAAFELHTYRLGTFGFSKSRATQSRVALTGAAFWKVKDGMCTAALAAWLAARAGRVGGRVGCWRGAGPRYRTVVRLRYRVQQYLANPENNTVISGTVPSRDELAASRNWM